MTSPQAASTSTGLATAAVTAGAILYTAVPLGLNISGALRTWITLPDLLTFSVYTAAAIACTVFTDRRVRARRPAYAVLGALGVLFWSSATFFFVMPYCPK